MENAMPYIILGVMIVVLLYSVIRNLNERSEQYAQDRDFRQRGSESPHYDSPDIRGRGGFGRDKASEQNADFDWIKRRRDSQEREGIDTSYPTNDDPDVRGRGGFGRDKG